MNEQTAAELLKVAASLAIEETHLSKKTDPDLLETFKLMLDEVLNAHEYVMKELNSGDPGAE